MNLLLPALLLFAKPSLQPPLETWYGPVEVRFAVPNVTDPYDPAKTDVEVKFEGPQGTETRIAFYDGTQWRARLLAQYPGTYKPKVFLNDGELPAVQVPEIEVKNQNPLSFVRIDASEHAFVLGDGTRYWPIGHDLGWSSPGHELQDMMPLMHGAGLNWARIWNTYWDGRCPYWNEKKKLAPYEIDQSAMAKWDAIVRMAEMYDIRFQWVLHHHGQVSTTVNPNWQDHPWNAKNGGFLKTAEEFFTDPEAKRRTKAMLRYLVARYADSPSIMAWELFNEVQFADATKKHWDQVGAWHDEMAKYIKSIDPYHHLVTTSSDQSAPIWAETDYRNDHGYPASLLSLLLSSKAPDSKPYFFGEVGLDGDNFSEERDRGAIRDGIWSAMLAGHAGAGQYWYWDKMEQFRLYREFATATKIIGFLGLNDQLPLKPLKVKVDSETGGDLVVAPGRSWAKSDKQEFTWPQEADSASMGLVSTFLQGSAHPEMGKPEMKISFEAKEAGTFSVGLGEVSAGGGGAIKISLDGEEKFSSNYAPGTKVNKTVSFDFGAGHHTVLVHNPGVDWIVVNKFVVTGLASAVVGEGAEGPGYVILRLRAVSPDSKFSVSGLGLGDGPVRVRVVDLATAAAYDEDTKLSGGVLSGFRLHGRDVLVSIRK